MTDCARKAATLDANDPLAFARTRFTLPKGVTYLDGNSLGPLPRGTPAALVDVVERQWGQDLIKSWNKHGWIEWPARIAGKLAPLVGAKPHELLVADSTSVSLFKLLAAAVRARPGRSIILTEKGNFPTDRYVAQGLAEMLGLEVKEVARELIQASIDRNTAAVMLTHVDYRSAAIHDMREINEAAGQAGAFSLWDLSHSAGALEVELGASGADLAVGCGYKYLNGGPGAPAFVFVANRLQAELHNPLQGWMGDADPFAFEQLHRPANGISRFQSGTPPILGLAALEAGLDTFAGIAIGDIAAKSRSLSQLFIEEVEARCGSAVELSSPRLADARGSHVVFAHSEAYAVVQALIARGIIGDFRKPDLMRFGFAPLYNSHVEVVHAARSLGDLLATGEWDQPRFRTRARVI